MLSQASRSPLCRSDPLSWSISGAPPLRPSSPAALGVFPQTHCPSSFQGLAPLRSTVPTPLRSPASLRSPIPAPQGSLLSPDVPAPLRAPSRHSRCPKPSRGFPLRPAGPTPLRGNLAIRSGKESVCTNLQKWLSRITLGLPLHIKWGSSPRRRFQSATCQLK